LFEYVLCRTRNFKSTGHIGKQPYLNQGALVLKKFSAAPSWVHTLCYNTWPITVHANGTGYNTKRTSPHDILFCINVMDAACQLQRQEGQNRLWNSHLISLENSQCEMVTSADFWIPQITKSNLTLSLSVLSFTAYIPMLGS